MESRKENRVATNSYGFECERVIRELLREVGIAYEWASSEEDMCGTDCWLGPERIAVDFTVISDRKMELLQAKIKVCMERGVVPVVLEQGMLMRAANGSSRALQEFGQEVRLQVPLKLKQLNGSRMTRVDPK